MLLLTAPSKTQNIIDRSFPVSTVPLLIDQSRELIDTLQQYSIDELCSLMKMSRTLGELTAERIAVFQLPFTASNSRQAIFTFQGDAYDAITPMDYSKEQLLHAQGHLAILSGLYGVLRPLDLMQPYRLEMGTRLETARGRNLYQFWGKSITEVINRECEKHGITSVVNLASTEYYKVLQKKDLIPAQLTVTFREQKGDTYKTVPIHSKRARGMMIHFMIENRLSKPEQLRKFTAGGYALNEQLSTENEWTFTRKAS